MGFFSRTSATDTENELLENAGLPSSEDLNEAYFDKGDTSIEVAPLNPPTAPSYGIEDAIALMRTLPAENTEVVVAVVKQTLESTRINVDDIIKDAKNKEARLLNKNAQLEKEIRQLEQQIAKRNQQISALLADHKETVSVRERLQLANKPSLNKAPVKQNPTSSVATSSEAQKTSHEQQPQRPPETSKTAFNHPPK